MVMMISVDGSALQSRQPDIVAPGETAGLLEGEIILTCTNMAVVHPLGLPARLAVSVIGRTVGFRPAARGVVRMVYASIGERPSC
jgi:hypothetical protein